MDLLNQARLHRRGLRPIGKGELLAKRLHELVEHPSDKEQIVPLGRHRHDVGVGNRMDRNPLRQDGSSVVVVPEDRL